MGPTNLTLLLTYGNPVPQDQMKQTVIGTRLLGQALAQLSLGDEAGAAETLHRAVAVMLETGSLDHISLAATKLFSVPASPTTDRLMQEALTAASQLCGTTQPLLDADGSSLLMLSIVHAKLNDDPTWIVAVLAQSPRASLSSMISAAQYLKWKEPSSVGQVDQIMKETNGWVSGALSAEPSLFVPKGASQPKAVLFVLDCSGSMSGARLNSCKQALLDIYDGVAATLRLRISALLFPA
eukprot:SAG22_NODE_1444_length_4412_cov_2.784605_3_plen_239_part_00